MRFRFPSLSSARFALIIAAQLLLPARAGAEFSVVVSIKPIHSLVAGLMQDLEPPLLLINNDVTPWDFTPDEQSARQLHNADLVIWTGPELEQKLAPVIADIASDRVIELLSSERMKILPSRQNPDRRDPFFWMDNRNMLILIDALTETLIEADPRRTHVYKRNRQRLAGPLQRIDREYEYGYRGLKAGFAVAYFDSLQYFEQAYALKILDWVAGTPGELVTSPGLLRVRELIGNDQAGCILFDRSMPPAHLDLLTMDRQANLGELDVLGSSFEAGPELYLNLMKHNTDIIKRCLNVAPAQQPANEGVETTNIGGRFVLVDQWGGAFTERELLGRYSLIFFGYTHCPDICPTSLSVVSQAMTQLGDRAKNIRPVFITVDPERDTVGIMHEYVGYFDPDLIGLTGSVEMITRVAEQYRVKFSKVTRGLSGEGDYAVDHSASLFLMAPDGRFVTKFSSGISATALAENLTRIVTRQGEKSDSE